MAERNVRLAGLTIIGGVVLLALAVAFAYWPTHSDAYGTTTSCHSLVRPGPPTLHGLPCLERLKSQRDLVALALVPGVFACALGLRLQRAYRRGRDAPRVGYVWLIALAVALVFYLGTELEFTWLTSYS